MYIPRRTESRVSARWRWFTPVILATQEAEIRRIEVQSQLQENGS
jgi:hypothetical protein